MPTIKIVPFPGVPGPQGEPGPAAAPVTYTPTFSATGLTFTSVPATGRYIKNGKFVYVHINVELDNVTNFGTGQYKVTLPFPAASNADAYGGSIHKYIDGSPTHYSIKGHLFTGDTNMYLWTVGGSPDEGFVQGNPVTLTTADKFHMSFVYEAQ
jgi:hypothetical protein